MPVGPTFESLNCRLAALIAAVQTESQLGKQQAKLDKAAQKAKERKETAEAACAQGDAKAATAYPIASFTWLLVSAQQSDPTKGKKLADFLRWALTDGQKDAPTLDYAPLPSSLVTKLMPRIDSIAPRLP